MMLHIRNMESRRCIEMVKHELDKLELHYQTVELGEVVLKGNISEEKFHLMDFALRNAGLEIMNDKSTILIEKIKEAIYQLVHFSNDFPKPNYSVYISKKVNRDYTGLSLLFNRMEGVTIEKYIIAQKIERIKEMLVYDELSLNDIAYQLQYSSVAHLSNQFKKVTGLTPSFFRQLRNASRNKTKNV